MIKLKEILQEGKVLSVFDFDDTIAKSDAWIYVTKQGRTIKKLDPAQFAVYKPNVPLYSVLFCSLSPGFTFKNMCLGTVYITLLCFISSVLFEKILDIKY